MLCHVHAYEYFGGVPRLTIPDNLRTGVLKNTCMETVLNCGYSEVADQALRNETFFSLADAKEAVAEKLEELNGYAFKKREGNRCDTYIHEEKEFM